MSTKKQRNAATPKKSAGVLWAGLLTVLLVVGGSIWYLTTNRASSDATPTGTLSASTQVPGEWGMGNPDAKLRIVEFGDYQCGACAFFHPIVKEIMEEYYDEVYFVWHHFPLINSHQFAVMAASAAEAAGRQGKFWEMHDLILSNQQAWARGMASSAFLSYARQLGLDDEQFLRDVRDEEILSRIEQQYNLGLSLNIRSVPSFFFNGELIQNPPNVQAFRALIETKLAELE